MAWGTLAVVQARGRTAIAAATLSLLVSACSSDAKQPGAAEPATAPPTSAAAAGNTVGVGDSPEGIVYDASTNTLVVSVQDPTRLLLLDPTTLAVRHSIPLPGKRVRHLQLERPGGPVLVPDESAKELLQIPLPSGAPAVVTKVGKQPHDAGATANDIVVGNEYGGSISVVRDGKVRATVSDLKQPGGVIGDGSTVGVVDVGTFTLSTYDVGPTVKRIARVPAGKGPTHGNLISGNRILVSDTRGNAMLVFTVSPLRQVGRLALPGTPYGISHDPAGSNLAWITLTARNEVVGLDVTTDTPKVIARYPTVRQPNTVAVAPGSRTLWITGTEAGVIERITR